MSALPENGVLLLPAELTPAEVRSLDREFGQKGTEEVLGWAWQRFGTKAAIGTSFQGAGLVMMETDRSKAPEQQPQAEEAQQLGRPRRERQRPQQQEEELKQVETKR